MIGEISAGNSRNLFNISSLPRELKSMAFQSAVDQGLRGKPTCVRRLSLFYHKPLQGFRMAMAGPTLKVFKVGQSRWAEFEPFRDCDNVSDVYTIGFLGYFS